MTLHFIFHEREPRRRYMYVEIFRSARKAGWEEGAPLHLNIVANEKYDIGASGTLLQPILSVKLKFDSYLLLLL